MLLLYLFPCFFVFLGSQAGKVSFINPCVWSDKKCVKESSLKAIPHIVGGNPELNIPPLDPITIEEGNADNGDLKLHFKDLKIVGLAKSKITDIELRDSSQTATLEFEFPVHSVGKYKASGKLLVLDVVGDGDFEMKCGKLWIQIDIGFKTVQKNGEEYCKISSSKYKYDPKEKVHFKFTNLYNGDQDKAKVLMDLINQNSNELLKTIGQPIIETLVAKGIGAINNLFQNVPKKELIKFP